MQLKKASKKTAKTADIAAPAPESDATPETSAKQRASKSSKAKKTEGIEMTSGKRHHKLASPVINETPAQSATLPVDAKPIKDAPTHVVHAAQVAELAYSYWAERGYTHGAAEEDWLRAERALSGR